MVDFFEGVVRHGEEVTVKELQQYARASMPNLLNIPVEDILDAMEEFSKCLLSRRNPLHEKYPGSGLPFIGSWFRRKGLEAMLETALGTTACLDRFIPGRYQPDRAFRAFPRGVAIHWIAGNVPTLGILSLASGILTKNVNILKVPAAVNTLLADLMREFADVSPVAASLANSVTVVRYPREDDAAASGISRLADTRIIWGGDESTRAIKTLPTKTTCMDIVFPDRTSFAIICNSCLKREYFPRLTRLIAHDASVFEQKACASPHTVFLETENNDDVNAFAKSLGEAMERMLKTIPKATPSQKEVSAILNLRSQYDMFQEAWYPKGTEYTILSDSDPKLGPPIGNRTVYVRKLPDMKTLATLMPPNIQSVGIAADDMEMERLTTLLGACGVHRFTPLGAMTHFELPWDGIFIPQQLVRWTSRPE